MIEALFLTLCISLAPVLGALLFAVLLHYLNEAAEALADACVAVAFAIAGTGLLRK